MYNQITHPERNEETVLGIRNLSEGLWTTSHDSLQGEVYLYLVSVSGVTLHSGGAASGIMRLSEMHVWDDGGFDLLNATFTRFRGTITLKNKD